MYRLYEQEFENGVVFDPIAALFGSAQPTSAGPNPKGQMQIPMPVPLGTAYTATLKLACVESAALSSWCELKRRWTYVNMNLPAGDPFIREETVSAQTWDHRPVP